MQYFRLFIYTNSCGATLSQNYGTEINNLWKPCSVLGNIIICTPISGRMLHDGYLHYALIHARSRTNILKISLFGDNETKVSHPTVVSNKCLC